MADVVILTGGTRGLGAALASHLQRREDLYSVVLARRIPAANMRSENQFWFECELTEIVNDPAKLGALQNQLGQLFKQLPVSSLTFINNAGSIEPLGVSTGLDGADLLNSININMSAPALIAALLCRWTSEKKIPMRVLNISSGAALRPIQGWAAYCSTKAAARMFFDAMALDGIKVIHIDPGVMDTEMQGAIRKAVDLRQHSYFEAFWLAKELRSPDSVASALVAEHFP